MILFKWRLEWDILKDRIAMMVFENKEPRVIRVFFGREMHFLKKFKYDHNCFNWLWVSKTCNFLDISSVQFKKVEIKLFFGAHAPLAAPFIINIKLVLA